MNRAPLKPGLAILVCGVIACSSDDGGRVVAIEPGEDVAESDDVELIDATSVQDAALPDDVEALDVPSAPDTEDVDPRGDDTSDVDELMDASDAEHGDPDVDSDAELIDVGADDVDSPDSEDGADAVDLPLLKMQWSVALALPEGRSGTVVGGQGASVFIASGADGSGTLTADIQTLNTDANVWGTGSGFAPVRRFAAGAMLGGQLYVALGLAPNNQGMGSMVRYNPAQNAWKVLLDNPSPGCCAGAVGTSDRIWLLGGRLASDQVQSFSPAQGVWLTHAPMPVGASFPATVASPDGAHIYVFGGATADTPDGGTTLDVAQRYSIADNSWTTLPDMPAARAYASAVWLNGRVWVFGGESAQEPAQATVFVYDPESELWLDAEPMPRARSRHGAVVSAGRVILVGGEDADGSVLQFVDIGLPVLTN